MLGFQLTERQTANAAHMQCDGLVLLVDAGADQIVSGRQAQPFPGMEHGEVFVMGIRIAGKQTGENTAQQSIRFRRNMAPNVRR